MKIKNQNPCWIIGVDAGGPDLLTPAARQRLLAADLVLGDGRFLDIFQPVLSRGTERRSFSGHITDLPDWIEEARSRGRRVVVLASGDPLFFGIGAHLLKKLPADTLKILENPTTPQRAFNRLGIPWHDARFLSIHARDGGEWRPGCGPDHPLHPLCRALMSEKKIAILTSPANTPNRIARLLTSLNLEDHFHFSVAERLTTDAEKIHRNLPADQAHETPFAEPNLVILQRRPGLPAPLDGEPRSGIADHRFLPGEADTGMITKREVRAISLAALALRSDSIVWDIGAGSGSVGLEAARLCMDGYVYAMEKNPQRCITIRENRSKLRSFNYRLLENRAPQGLDQWPDPDAVFIGGSDGALAELIRLVAGRLRPTGRLVMNFITLENVQTAMDTLEKTGLNGNISQVQINRSQPISQWHRLVADNPVWIIVAHGEKS